MLKRWKNIVVVALLQLAGIGNLLEANPQYIPIDRYTLTEGLSQIHVTEIYLHSTGYLWIGTQDGLNRYDGHKFKIYRNQPFDSVSLISNYILDIEEDLSGNLWIATNQGLSMFDPVSETFKNFENDPEDEHSISANMIYDILIDVEGGIWAQTINSLEEYDAATESFKHHIPHFDPENFLAGREYFSQLVDSKGRHWVSTKDGLQLFDQETGLFSNVITYELEKDNQFLIKALHEDPGGLIWFGTTDGLYIFNENDGSITKRGVTNNISPSVNTILQVSEDNLWLGTEKGLIIYDRKNDTYTGLTGVIDNAAYFKPEMLSSLLIDSSRVLWLGGIDGLIKYDMKGPSFELFQKSPVSKYQLSSNLIASIYEDKYGLLWVGTWGFGLNILNRTTGKSIHYSSDAEDPELRISQDNVHVIKEDKAGNIWVGTNNGLNIKHNTSTGFIRLCEKYPGISCHIFDNNRIYSIVESLSGRHLIGSKNGLHILNDDNGNLESIYAVNFNNHSVPLKTVHSIFQISDSSLWLGTENGVFILDEESFNCNAHYFNSNSADGQISNNSVYSVFQDSREMIWAGTASGLNRYNPNTGTFIVFSEKDGLPNNLIYNIIEDDKGYLWISTNMGLSRFDPVTESFRNYEITDGLQNQEFNLGAAYKSPSGELFFGGISGFNSFSPSSIHKNAYIPPVVISSVKVINGIGAYEIKLSRQEMVIPPDVSLFTIDFAALDFTNPEKNHFEYSLTRPGESPKWINIETKNSATFSNLPPGEYIFNVRGSNNDRVWNKTGTTLHITVQAPYWRTKLAYAIYFITGLTVLLLFIYFRSRTMSRMKRLLKIQEKTSQLLAEQKELLTRKNKNITDSINYAKRIQEAMMPNENLFDKYLPKSFILHQPKDIVSGDFFWIYKSGHKVFVAAVDCTGHGVPGAFMSIIGFELFRKITHTEGIQEPSSILQELNEDFAEIFGDVKNVTLRDGMDIALCVIDKKTSVVEFAGAFNPMYLVRDDRIIEIKGDRYSIGLDEHQEDEEQIFHTHRYELTPNDMIYIFTDGYADQFGGPEGKKFKYRRFRHLLLAIHKMEMNQQKNILIDTFNNWSKDFEQVDDIMVIGIKPDFSK